jgi:hypothetical protein
LKRDLVATPKVPAQVEEDQSEERRRPLINLVEVCFSFRLFRFINCCADDKKLGSVLKKMSMTNITGVEEVNIFKNDGTVIHITGPKSIV